VRAALLVPDQDVAEGWVVAQDVVQGKDDPTRIPEQHVHALPEDGFADHVGTDARPTLAAIGCLPVRLIALVKHLAAGTLHGLGRGSARPGDVASPLPRGGTGSVRHPCAGRCRFRDT
jgi:hypothetical protein